jgi:hypothetical protein
LEYCGLIIITAADNGGNWRRALPTVGLPLGTCRILDGSVVILDDQQCVTSNEIGGISD